MSDAWYYGERGQQRGPISLAALRDRLASGVTGGDELVWRDGMANWATARDVPDVADAIPATSAPLAIAAPAGGPVPDDAGGPPGMMAYYVPPQGGVAYVGFWWRALAHLIDYVITYVAGAAVELAIVATINGLAGRSARSQLAGVILAGLAGLIVYWLYYALMESSTKQATLGKLAIGVRVTDLDGQPLTFGPATGRYFAKIVSGLTLGIGFFMIGWTLRKQGLHDLIASTLVVHGRAGSGRGFDVEQPIAHQSIDPR